MQNIFSIITNKKQLLLAMKYICLTVRSLSLLILVSLIMKNDKLIFDRVVFFDKKNFIYIEAERLERIKKNTFLFKNVSYT